MHVCTAFAEVSSFGLFATLDIQQAVAPCQSVSEFSQTCSELIPEINQLCEIRDNRRTRISKWRQNVTFHFRAISRQGLFP